METTPAGSLCHHKIIRILNHLYDKVETLEEFALRVISSDRLRSPDHGKDDSYENFLTTTLVCFPRGARTLPRSWNIEQQSEQNEVVLRVVERIQRREGLFSSNLLTRGYYAKSEKSGAQISTSSCSIEYGHSNYSTNRLLYPTWKKLLSRIGDDAMEFVLENLVVFLFASSACYIQLTGSPLYELWPFRRFCARSYQRSAAARRLCNSLLNDSKRKHCRVSCKSENNRLRCGKSKKTPAADVAKPSSYQKGTPGGHQMADVPPASGGEFIASEKRKCGGTVEDEHENRKKFCDAASGHERRADVAPLLCFKFQPTANESDAVKLCKHTSCDKQTDFVFPQGSVDNLVSSVIESFAVLASNDDVTSMEDRGQPSSSSRSSLCNSSASGSHLDESRCSFLKAPSEASRRNAPSFVGADVLLLQRSDRPAIREISPSVDFGVRLTAFDGRPNMHSIDVASCKSDRKHVTDDAIVDDVSAADVGTRSGCGGRRRQRVRKGKLSEGERAATSDAVPFSTALAVKRAGLFYSKNFSETFPPRYLLAGFVATHDDAAKLTRQILETTVNESPSTAVSCAGRVVAFRESECCDAVKKRLDEFMRHLIVNHRSCPYGRLLDFHCPAVKRRTAVELSAAERASSSDVGGDRAPDFSGVPAFVRGRKTPVSAVANLSDKLKSIVKRRTSAKYNVSRLLELHNSLRQVYLFVRACCLRVLPTGLFGSASNRNVFFRNVRKCIGLGRFEQLSLGDLMTNMKVTQCRWMAEIHSNLARLRLLAKIVYWLLSSYVIVLIRSYFYVTDTAVYRNRLFYYRKAVWKKIHRKGLTAHINKRIFKRLTAEEATRSVSSGKSLGFASLRFLPKLKTLRPIVNMSQTCQKTSTTRTELAINYQLRDVQQVVAMKHRQYLQRLQQLTRASGTAFGSSVSSLDDIYARWKHFVESRRQRDDCRPLYFVKVDIKDCYDSIDQFRLFEIVCRLLDKSERFAVRRYATVVATGGRLRRSFLRDASPEADFNPSFLRFVREKIKGGQWNNAVFVDQVPHATVDAATLIGRLRSHLLNSIVRVGRQYFKQTCGIAQGSVLSTLLCDIYYSDMEMNRITVSDQEEILMRQVDDYLFVTPDHQSAVDFLDLMSYGVADYNCRINRLKTIVNFPVDVAPGEDGVRHLPDNALFPWCGLLINAATLAVHADFTRYAGVHIADTMTVDVSRNPGRALRHKLFFSLRSRCHPIYLDADVNSVAAVAENVYRVFLLAAFKFHCHVRRLPTRNNPAFLVDTIYEVANFVTSRLLMANKSRETLERSAVQLLCLEAFVRKLQRHQGGYGSVLRVIGKRLKKLRTLVGSRRRAELDAVVGDKLPADFECMLC